MADMTDTLKSLLGDDADNKLASIINMLNSGSTHTPDHDKAEPSAITPEFIAQAQSIMSHLTDKEGDDRSRLLMSLKPYMRKTRQDSIDNAIKMLNMTRLSKLLKL